MQKIGIFYGSSTGNTESAAKKIQKELGEANAQLFDASTATGKDLDQFTNVIFGTSTWGIGDLQDDFDKFIPQIKTAGLNGKTIALFGCGDQESYSDTFVDGMGAVWEIISLKGCKIIGQTSTEGYTYYFSRAEVDGELVGLALDEDNQGNLTDTRIKEWVERIKPLFQ